MKKILIVENQPLVALVLQTYAEEAGCELSGISESKVALERIRVLRPDLVVLNLAFDDVGGFLLVQELRRGYHELRNIPVIVICDKPSAINFLKAKEVQAPFVKPLCARQLLDKIREILKTPVVQAAAQ
ncbi:MAG: response regulator [Candidatus Omnitrophota bacterium]